MNESEIKLKIQTISDTMYNGSYRFFKSKSLNKLLGEDIVKFIYGKLSTELHNPCSLAVYCFMNNIFEPPKCNCGNNTKFNTTTKQFLKYCSNACKWVDNESIQEAKRKTCLSKYGSINVLSSDYGKEKSTQTNIAKYGVSNYTQTDEYKEKVKGQTRDKTIVEKVRLAHLKNYYNTLGNKFDGIKPLFNLEEYNGVAGYKRYKWECLKCGSHFLDSISFESPPTCRKCKPLGTKHEIFIKEFLDGYNIPYEYNNRKILPCGKEIDIFIPSKNIGVEICGLFWHSTIRHSDKNYHLNKLLSANSVNVDLITIFDDEFYNNKRLVINRLKSKLGLINRRIYARKCIIKSIDSKTSKQFLKKYHIQGSINGKYKYGLYYNNRLVSVMTFNKGRIVTGHKNEDGVYELGRYATISNFNIIGGAGKLFKHFIREVNPNQVYSYCDLRWNTGKVYEKIGMVHTKNTTPNYFYTLDCKNRLHRFLFHKNKLKDMESYNSNLTEDEIMRLEGYFKIYDCGSKLYTWTKS
jgi:hypothetical protein